jgi:hypothetical protein
LGQQVANQLVQKATVRLIRELLTAQEVKNSEIEYPTTRV